LIFRPRFFRTLMASAATVAAVALAGCETDSTVPTARALRPLSQEMISELEKRKMPKESPVLVRLFKEESEVEVWKQDESGRFALLKVYPICRWSGELGPKMKEGDRQAPEGFYTIKPTQMNPNSHYYLSFDIGYPNAFDRAHGYTGGNLMVHGDCSSRGCYAMTDDQISEIYALAREAFFGGQRSFQIQAYPFRMTPLNMARHRGNPNMPFWKMLKEGNDHFEVTHLEPKVDICDKRYVFDAEPPAATLIPGRNPPTLNFNAAGRCPAYQVQPEIAAEVADKGRRDDQQTAELSHRTPMAPIRTYQDGGMHPVFLAKLKPTVVHEADGTIRTIVEPRVTPSFLPDTAAPQVAEVSTGSVAANNGQAVRSAAPSSPPAAANAGSGNLFTRLFSSEPEKPEQKAKSDSGFSVSRLFGLGGDDKKPASPPPAPPPKAAATPTPKPAPAAKPPAASAVATNAAPAKPQPKSQAAETDLAAASSSPAGASTGLINGAQPVVPTGSFESRWSGLR
jgi:murein L,D-transpeptidase YafK